ncbi:MAG TPA: hypothetical protein VFN35_30345 [Ktedonobacteraceae bacterium]|nr:hypothetical protein [Ktedonobacteraceae bacterium]
MCSADVLPTELTALPGIHHFQAQSLTIFTENEPQPVTLDGEVSTQTAVQARVAEEQLELLVPGDTCGNAVSTRTAAIWIAYVMDDSVSGAYSYHPFDSYLLSWVPDPLIKVVQHGMDCNSDHCHHWIADLDSVFIQQLRQAGLIV